MYFFLMYIFPTDVMSQLMTMPDLLIIYVCPHSVLHDNGRTIIKENVTKVPWDE